MKENKSAQSVGAVKIIVYIAVSFLLSVLQSTVGKRIGIFGATAQMTLALTVAAAYYGGPIFGGICGLACGVFTDALGGMGIAVLPLFYTLTGWIIGARVAEKRGQHGASLGSYAVNLGAATLAGEVVTLIMMALSSFKLNFLDALIYIVLPEALNTYIFGFLLGLLFFAAEKLASKKQENTKDSL